MGVHVFAVAVLSALSLVGVSLWAQEQGSFRTQRNPDGTFQVVSKVPSIISGADIAFWPSGNSMDPNKVAGRWMVRIDGQWRETTGSIAMQPAR